VGPGVVAVAYSGDAGVVMATSVVSFLALVAQTWWRLETAAAEERRALSWLALSVTVVTLASLTATFTAWTGINVLAVAVLALIPVAMAVGVLRPEAIDVRGLAVASAVMLTLVIGYVAYFTGAVAALRLVAREEPPVALLAVVGLLGGLLLRPAAAALRTVMDQLLFGERPDPLAAANRVVGRIANDPQEALESLRVALTVPSLALWRGDELLLSAGGPAEHTRRLHVAGDGGVELEVGLRPGDLRLSSDDLTVLRLVAPLLVHLERATRLAADVRRLRSEELLALADERRRLRDELHDDLGPTLTGIGLTSEAARNLLTSDPEAAADLLATVRRDTARAIHQVRALAYGMRPRALDEVGLVEALRQAAAVEADFVTRGDLHQLPAAVEVAAYRVVLESLTNVARHCPGGRATVTLIASDSALDIDVVDSGGGASPWQPGVGLTSMGMRVSELGGRLSAGPGPDGGHVRAVLPLASTG
jgi:signal transduction histidine kinase